jgi:cyclopropane fatty-acyl-phospholipid synthase-like methyltransferase
MISPSGSRQLKARTEDNVDVPGHAASRPSQARTEGKVDVEGHAAQLYDRSGPWFGERRYFNQGYWRDEPASWDAAGDAMAQLLGEVAGLGPGQRVLDAGFGWGEQDRYWLDVFEPARIVGLNLSVRQVEWARQHLDRSGYGDRVDFQVGSATNMPVAGASFDRVVALESAHHFDTREAFFAEAFRVLVPGGRLALVDIVPMPSRADDLGRALAQSAMRRGNSSMMPRANVQDRNQLGRALVAAGFVGVDVVSIREHVYAPAASYLAAQQRAGTLRWRPSYLDDPAALTSVAGLEHRMFYWTVLAYLGALSVRPLVPELMHRCDHGVLDYIVAAADKPEAR